MVELESNKTLRLVISYRCPLRCKACYAPHSDLVLPTQLMERVIENAVAEGFDTLAIGGGEPLATVRETLHAIETATRAGMLTAITTSGYGLNERMLRALENAGLNHLQLSLGDNRVNIVQAYGLMTTIQRKCGFGVNLLLSPRLIKHLPRLLHLYDSDKVDQVTLLLPRGTFGGVPRFSRDDFMMYYLILKTIKLKHTAILVDCATQQVLQGQCASIGCSFFPDGTVSRCAFGCAKRIPWNGSLTKSMEGDPGECGEGKKIEVEIAPVQCCSTQQLPAKKET